MGKLKDAILAPGLPERDRKNEKRVNLWAFVWAGSLLLAMASITALELPAAVVLFLLATHLFCFYKMVGTYRYFLQMLDEMERKIQMDALAISVAVAIALFSGGSILAVADIIPMPPAFIIVLGLSLSYTAGLIIGRLRLS